MEQKLLIILLLSLVTLNGNGDEPRVRVDPTKRSANQSSPKADDPINFNREIRPLLARHCLNCHGPDEQTREAGLRLDLFDTATAEADSGEFPLVPGKPDQSELLRRVILDASDSERMPPTGKGLNQAEIDLIRKWIKGGGKYESHWAFVPPTRPPLPKVKDRSWVTNEIDRFVLKRLEDKGWNASPLADRYILARRVFLDLTGIPPTIEQVDQFVEDSAPDAFEQMVDRVLASPQFGERWARVWLDLARYADSQGYAQDSPRKIYRYRDWVIDAINRNLPFDQFTVEQIAGDMLTNPHSDQILATAFHRNTMTNSEGGTDDEEFRTAAVVDRVNTSMQIWMGMTMGCAQCHSHKYDPISQEEYFSVFSILNQTADADRGNETPLHSEISTQRLQQQEKLKTEIAKLKRLVEKDGEKEKGTPTGKHQLPKGELKARFVRVQGLGKMFLHLAEVQVFDGNKNLALNAKSRQSSTAFSGPARFGNDGNTDGDFQKKSVTHSAEENDPWWEVDLGKPAKLTKLVVWNRTDNDGVRDRLQRFRVVLYDQDRNPIWTQVSEKVPNPSSEFKVPASYENFSQPEKNALLGFRSREGGGLSKDAKRLQELQSQLKKISGPDITTPVMQQLPKDKQRKTFIQIRGNFRNPGKQVGPGTPSVFHPLETRNEFADRLDFARWLVSRQNPVTARVIVNRYWENLFGNGIVITSEDFGTQGELPSHPQLLDYLAVEFMEHDWDVKWLLKKIVTSSTYRQSTRVSMEMQQADPQNRWLGRGPRMRLSAEMIRDQALSVAEVLSTKMNGPSVRPPRPKLGLRAAFGGSTDWEPSPGEDAFRRGLYTTWRRTAPYPSMTTFDAPSREFCTIRRSRTNTPLQALVTLNDPVFVDAAERLAKLVWNQSEKEERRLVYLFRKVLVRPPRESEINFLKTQLHKIQANIDEKEARELAKNAPGGNADPIEFASWVVLGNVILNLDETLARP